MFNKKTEDQPKQAGNATTIIAAGTTFTGNIECNNDIRIDGAVVGNITSTNKVVIGNDGTVTGNIEGLQADVMGTINGDIHVSELLNLRAKATIKGDIFTSSLQMEPTVTFNGMCHMGMHVVDMKQRKAV
jgi:cytoskeletal protein CcmA (bactofilin family)